MEMNAILKEMEANLENMKGALVLYEARVKILQENFDKAQKELEEEKAKMKPIIDDAYALEQSIEMLKLGNFAKGKANTETTEKKVEKTVTKKNEKPEVKKDEESMMWKHKKAYVLKLNEHNNVLDRWPSQKAAARAMNWDQSSVSKFMRMPYTSQLKKKGFYLCWEY